MIAIDSSAIVAILRNGPEAPALAARLAAEPAGARIMSVASYLETGAVLAGGLKRDPMRAIPDLDDFLAAAGVTLAPVDEAQARIALEARIRFGKGFGAKAGLNFGDCFSYALAKSLDAPLLFIGDDFPHTDLTPAL